MANSDHGLALYSKLPQTTGSLGNKIASIDCILIMVSLYIILYFLTIQGIFIFERNSDR